MGSHQKAEIVTYDVGMEGSLRWQLDWGHNRRFLRTLKSAQPKNFCSLVDVQNINRLSYEGV
jgi:hypothetical protein